MDSFVHLHVHSQYSLLDGGNRIEDLLGQTKQLGMNSIALTDHGNLFGAVHFYIAARSAGIKPILGTEAYISPTSRFDKSTGSINSAAYHMILLAMDHTGWLNLMKLSSRAYLEGFYYRPRIDLELLAQHNQGLICTTACLGGQVPQALLAGQSEKARQIASQYRDIFGPDRFFIEIQRQGLADQDRVNPLLADLARQLGVGLVGTNDVHFLRRQDKPAHDILTCISTGRTLAEGAGISYPPELYLKSPHEMRQALCDWPDSADNTLKIAEMCGLELDFSRQYLPVFESPDGLDSKEYLASLARAGLKNRFAGQPVPKNYADRLDWELKVMADKGYSSYFLIVNDFIQFARRNSIPAMPRGSGLATLIGYSLGMQEVDPIRYGLLFERFTDPQRAEAPDIDVDICQQGRSKVLQYVREKYVHVAQIITYSTLKARAALRDVARVMEIPLAEVDAICKKVPEQLGVTLTDALSAEPDLRRMHETDQRIRNLFDSAMKLEGFARNTGVHAAGVVVSPQPLEGIVPLCRQADSQDVITQWDGPTCEKAGLMKMDFLGLQTLSILQRTRELVAQSTGRDIDPAGLPLDDQDVYELFRQGQTDGVFQFESDGMKNVLMQIKPTRIEDLIAVNSLYRPGPMELIPTYCARKHGREEVPSIHPMVDDILAETYGIMCYQEQVMQVLNRLGRLPLAKALTLIKAISKKKHDVIAAQQANFLEGAAQAGIAKAEAGRLFELILRFAGYGFNKAHSTGYAILAYQTAYFKVHHPRQFLASLLTFESLDTDKVVQYMAEAKRMGVEIARPDINTCNSDFTVDGSRIRFGLAAVKGVGFKAVDAILAARSQAVRFSDLFHFCRHADLRAVNRATIEALIKCGAFDSLGAHRSAMIAGLDQAIQLGQQAADDQRSGQMNFFSQAVGMDENLPAVFPSVEPWSEARLLACEKETLGFYITSHPLAHFGRELASLSSPVGISLAGLDRLADRTMVTIGCMIAQIRPTLSKAGRSAGAKMAMLTLEDLTAKSDAIVFPDAYERLSPVLKTDAIVFVSGTVDRRREKPSLIIDQVIPIDQAVEQLAGMVLLRLGCLTGRDELPNGLAEILADHRGQCPLFLELRSSLKGAVKITIKTDARWRVKPTRKLVSLLVDLLGEDNLLLAPASTNGNSKSARTGKNWHRQPRAENPLLGPV